MQCDIREISQKSSSIPFSCCVEKHHHLLEENIATRNDGFKLRR